MVVDVRYHLASLVGIFFALGLGILVGTSITSDGRLLKEQASMIDSIEGQLGALRTEKNTLKANLTHLSSEVAAYRSFAQKVLPQVVAAHLDDCKVAVINLSSQTQGRQIESVLKQAGAVVTGSARIIEPSLLLSSSVLSSSAQLDPAFVQGLTAALTGEKSVYNPSFVRWAKPVSEKADWVVLVGGDGVDEPLRRLASALKQSGLRVVATVTGTEMRGLSGAGLPVVGATAAPMGLMALVELLAERQDATHAGGNNK